MEELIERLTELLIGWGVLRTVLLNSYTSSFGQHYTILVTKGIWYKVSLFVELEKIPLHSEDKKYYLMEYDHFTWNAVQKRINNIKNFFKKPDLQSDAARLVMSLANFLHPYFIGEVPKNYASDPDKYLKRGDIIATPFIGGSVHTEIYLGNGQVGHVSGHGGGKAAGVARIGRLLGDFTTEGTEKIWVLVSWFNDSF
ncbi:unnamed protein product [Caenorhabditis nigoni]